MNNSHPEGNYFNKYESSNLIYKRLVQGFFDAVENCLKEISYASVYEAGCGEGYVANFLSKSRENLTVCASDISASKIEQARHEFPHINFHVESIYNTKEASESFDLVVACEVLEHLEHPEYAINELLRITKKYLLISVPNEPIWRISNMARGKYWQQIGNTPGHIQHWSPGKFSDMVSGYCIVKNKLTPFPWTFLMCEKKI